MYKAFLSYAQLKEYLTFLMENDLIIHDEKAQMYRATDKGRKFLTSYEEMNDLLTNVPTMDLTIV